MMTQIGKAIDEARTQETKALKEMGSQSVPTKLR